MENYLNSNELWLKMIANCTIFWFCVLKIVKTSNLTDDDAFYFSFLLHRMHFKLIWLFVEVVCCLVVTFFYSPIFRGSKLLSVPAFNRHCVIMACTNQSRSASSAYNVASLFNILYCYISSMIEIERRESTTIITLLTVYGWNCWAGDQKQTDICNNV